jgi:2-hydroxychromene-2-carboxylate isomerase
MAEPIVDFWFDFASTYSYPAMMRVRAAATARGVAVRLRPFLLGPIFQRQGWASSPFNIYAAKGRYMWRDLERLCADLGLPFKRPEPFPQNGLTAARIALVGLDRGWGNAFCEGVFRVQFGEGRRIDDAGTLGPILRGLNVDPDSALASAQSDVNKARLRAQTEEAQRLGLFGAPSFITPDSELFWGNDRLEAALAWAQRTG